MLNQPLHAFAVLLQTAYSDGNAPCEQDSESVTSKIGQGRLTYRDNRAHRTVDSCGSDFVESLQKPCKNDRKQVSKCAGTSSTTVYLHRES